MLNSPLLQPTALGGRLNANVEVVNKPVLRSRNGAFDIGGSISVNQFRRVRFAPEFSSDEFAELRGRYGPLVGSMWQPDAGASPSALTAHTRDARASRCCAPG